MKKYYQHTINSALDLVKLEIYDATQKHNKFNSCHEGYSVILEELDELWDEVKKKKEKRDIKLMRKEAIQVAAMATRFIIDCC